MTLHRVLLADKTDQTVRLSGHPARAAQVSSAPTLYCLPLHRKHLAPQRLKMVSTNAVLAVLAARKTGVSAVPVSKEIHLPRITRTPKHPTSTHGFYQCSAPPAPGEVHPHNQQYYEFQWRVLNLCAEFYGAAEELVVSSTWRLRLEVVLTLCFHLESYAFTGDCPVLSNGTGCQSRPPDDARRG